MENKNRDLTIKNMQLREELEKLITSQTKLLQDSIKKEFALLKMQTSVIAILDENIKCFEQAIDKTNKLKEVINSKCKEKVILREKNNK